MNEMYKYNRLNVKININLDKCSLAPEICKYYLVMS